MRNKKRSAWLVAGLLSAAGFIIWPGCAWPPLPSTHHPVSFLKPADFSFKKNTHPPRAEILAKLGQPDGYYAENGVAYYKLDRLTRNRVMLLFFILPINTYPDSDRFKVAFLQFDEHDHLQKAELKIVTATTNFRYEASQWSRKNSSHKGPGGH